MRARIVRRLVSCCACVCTRCVRLYALRAPQDALRAGRGALAAALVQSESAVAAAQELLADVVRIRDEPAPPGPGVCRFHLYVCGSLDVCALLCSCYWWWWRAPHNTRECVYGCETL